jgi:hypothetical protein
MAFDVVRSDARQLDKLNQALLVRQIVDLRAKGRSVEMIAEEMDLNEAMVRRSLTKAMQGLSSESVEELRALENLRIDRMFLPVYERAVQGDLRAIDRAVLLMERRARMMGLDKPMEIDVRELRVELFGVLREVLDHDTYEKVISAVAG